MLLLSVAIITFNEEKNILRCLESVQTVADEILVVDSLSSDQTVSICQKFGARVVSQKFLGHIQQKNLALDLCSHNHVLSLDADEALDATLKQSILDVKKKWSHKGYSFNRLNNYVGQWIYHSGWYPDRKLRLVDRRFSRWEGVNPHDILKLQGQEKTAFLKGHLLHYSYGAVDEHIRQTNFFTDISAKEYCKLGRPSNIFSITLRPLFRFLRDYIFKRGFLDGRYGFIICMINAFGTFLKYVKIGELQKNKKT